MKKKKILIAAIAGIAVVIIGIVVAMFATGKFNELKKTFTDETTTVTQAETTQAVIPVSGRPKSTVPEAIVACEYSEYSEKSKNDLSEFEKLGFNTVIFDLTADNSEKVSALLETAKSNSLYFGIRADVSQGYDFLTEFS